MANGGQVISLAKAATIQDAINWTPPTGLGAFLLGTSLEQQQYTGVEWDYPAPPPFLLYSGACSADGSDNDNCTAACSSPSHIFASPATLHNCLAIEYIAANLTQADEASLQVAERFGITARPANSTDSPLQTIASCFGDAYFALTGDDNPTLPCMTLYRGGTIDRAQFIECYLQDICGQVDQTINSDLGGIGVYVSFLIQIAISLIGYVLLALFTSSTYYLLLLLNPRDFGSFARRAQQRLRTHRAALVSGLQEFHRTQCWFGLVIQIAALVAICRNDLAASSIEQVRDDLYFVYSVSLSNLACITFTYWYLNGNTERSWYTTLLSYSVSAIAGGMAIFGYHEFQYADATWVTVDHPVSSCGGNNPLTFCITPVRSGVLNGEWQLASTAINTDLRNVFSALTWIGFCSSAPLSMKTERSPLITQTKRILSCVFMPIFLVSLILQYVNLRGFGDQIDTSSWGIGQIVGVTIWAQPVFEYLHVELAGMTNGFAHRLPRDYKIATPVPPEEITLPDRSFMGALEEFFLGALRPPIESHAGGDSSKEHLQRTSRSRLGWPK